MTDGARPMPRAEAAELLGVPQDAGSAEVQRAFLRAARHAHPDTRPDADEAEHRDATEAFGRLLRARETLLAESPHGAPGPDGFIPRPGDPDGPRFRRAERRGLGGSLVVLALLAFLLVAIVTVQQGMQPQPFPDAPTAPPAASQAP